MRRIVRLGDELFRAFVEQRQRADQLPAGPVDVPDCGPDHRDLPGDDPHAPCAVGEIVGGAVEQYAQYEQIDREGRCQQRFVKGDRSALADTSPE
jgi:hypothetical protein